MNIAHTTFCVTVRLFLAFVLPAVLAACGGSGSGGPSPVDDTLRPISEEELSRMVLSIDELRPKYGAFIADEDNGALTLDRAVEDFYDPEGLRAQLVEYGWESGYQANYQVPEGWKTKGVSIALSWVHLFDASDGATARFKAPAPTGGSAQGVDVDEEALREAADRVHPFVVDIADEGGGFRDETTLEREGGSDKLSTVVVRFRRGRLIGGVVLAAYNFRDSPKLEDVAKDLAGKMNVQMAAVLAAAPAAGGR